MQLEKNREINGGKNINIIFPSKLGKLFYRQSGRNYSDPVAREC